MGSSANPYAAFGGDVIPPPAGDPYAQFGGSVIGAPPASSAAALPPATIGPGPSTLEKAGTIPAQPRSSPLSMVGDALDTVRNEIGNYTEEGRAEHPILSRIGDVLQASHELLVGGGPTLPKTGFTNNPAIVAMTSAPAAADLAEAATAKLTAAVDGVRAARAAKQAASAAQEAAEAAQVKPVNPYQFVYREPGPAPQHGTPVKVASPLDNATINRLPGGRDLSPEAIETLKKHIGGTPGREIEVGSTPKNSLLKAVEPVQKTIAQTGAKMAEVVENARPFKVSIADEGTIGGPGHVEDSLEEMRNNLPGGEEEKLNKTIDKELENADEALHSTDPAEVLAYRRRLGSQIDWNNIAKNPETPGEVQNATKANLYHVFTDKIHREIPGTADLDKIFQPNLELQSHLDAKLGTSVSRNAAEANAQQASELAKGKRQLQTDPYNEIIRKNRGLAGLPESDVNPSIAPTAQTTPVDQALNQAVAKFKAPASEQAALKTMLHPSVTAGKVFGTNTSWYDALKSFDGLTPAERAARFSNPNAVRQVLASQAKAQVARAVVKWGSIAAVSHVLGADKAILKTMLGE